MGIHMLGDEYLAAFHSTYYYLNIFHLLMSENNNTHPVSIKQF